jgi:hypothetical protein
MTVAARGFGRLLAGAGLVWAVSFLAACSDDNPITTELPETTTVTFADWEYVKGKYFYLVDPDASPPIQIHELYIYLDDVNINNNAQLGARPCRVWLDPAQETPGTPYLGWFHPLQQVIDYEIRTFDALPVGHRVLVLRIPVTQNQILAVAYTGTRNGQPVSVGTLSPALDDTLDLQVLSPSNTMWGTVDLTQSPWAPARKLELKSIYRLGALDIDPATFALVIRQDVTGPDLPVLENEFGVTTPLLEVLGLDQRDNGFVSNLVPDGRVDPEYFHAKEGILILPDSRPFDPSLDDIAGTPYRPRSWPTVAGASRPDTLGWHLGPGGVPTPSSFEVRWVEVTPGIYDTRRDELSRKWLEFSHYYLEATWTDGP